MGMVSREKPRIIQFGLFFTLIVLMITPTSNSQATTLAYAQTANISQQSNNAPSHNYQYGCTMYTQILEHCDPILNSFESKSSDTSIVKLVQVPSHPAYVGAKYQSALQMRADSLDIARIDNKATYSNARFTLYLAVQPTNKENVFGSLVSFRSASADSGWELVSLPSNSSNSMLRFSLFNSNGDAQTAGEIAVQSGKYLDVVGSFDGSTIKLYIDGALSAEAPFRGTFNPSPSLATPLSIGSGSYCSCSTLTASYDELRLYNRTLTDQEVSELNTSSDSLQSSPNPLVPSGIIQPKSTPSGLVGQWKFNGDLSDSSSYHNDAKYWSLTSSMAALPDGSVLMGEKNSGTIDIIDTNGKISSKPFAAISPIYIGWEEGLLGITLDNKYTTNHYVYAYYNYQDPDSGNIYARVVRFTNIDGTGTAMQIIYDKIPASNGFHTGGAVRFNPVDDKLYVFVGDGTQRYKAQDLSALNGKLLRLNRDGTIPSDNPFPGSPVYSYGLRNAFGLAFDPNGNGIVAESRENLYDQVDYIQRGGNYGWPTLQLPDMPPEIYTNNSSIKPIRSYYITPSPTEAIYYTGGMYPELTNSFIFGSVRGDLYSLKLSNSTHTLSSEVKLLLHLYPYEPIISIAQLPSGDIMIGGYNVYMIKNVDFANQKTLMFPIQANTTNMSINGMNYDLPLKQLTIDVPEAIGNNSVSISFPKSMLSNGITDVEYQANSTLANDGNTVVDFPYSEEVQQVGDNQHVALQFPNTYSASDHLQIIIDGSGASITKTIPEFGGIALIATVAIGMCLVIFARRFANGNLLKNLG